MSIDIKGKSYTMVHERLELVHASGKSFEVVESTPLQVGDRWLWRCVVKIDERTFVGNAEVKLSNARPGSPDSSNPWECGETSALGRCLGFAGFGAADAVCSADEITRSQPKAKPANGNSARMNTLFAKGKQAGKWGNPASMLERISEVLETEVTQANVGQLDDALLDLVEASIDGVRF